jgi:hypothetical protein
MYFKHIYSQFRSVFFLLNDVFYVYTYIFLYVLLFMLKCHNKVMLSTLLFF